MIKNLLKHYPNAIIQSDYPVNSFEHISWWTDHEESLYVGISNNDLKDETEALLSSLFTKVNQLTNGQNVLVSQQIWYQYLYLDGTAPDHENSHFRFIHFSFSCKDDRNDLSDALPYLFPSESIIVFRDAYSGIIVESDQQLFQSEEELISASQVLESDFYITTRFFIGVERTITSNFHEEFDMERKLFQFGLRTMPRKRVYLFLQILPYFMLDFLTLKQKNALFAPFHQLLKNDPDTRLLIKTYVENQSNTSQTAKELFLHRNSVQYRLDRLYEKNAIDLKQFDGAMYAYLACIEAEKL
jgi:DNA-binding PucR family transcriptional regulator